jgi:hypothetical protein
MINQNNIKTSSLDPELIPKEDHSNPSDFLQDETAKISWLEYFKIRCGSNKEGKFFHFLFQYVLFIMVGFLLCYVSIIVFYSRPHLFDSLGPKPNNDNGILLFIGLVLAGTGLMLLFCLLQIIEPPYILFNSDRSLDDYTKRYNRAIMTLIGYTITIILSNILTIISFKYLTRELITLVIPLSSLVIILVVSFLVIMIYAIFRCIFDCIIKDKQKLETKNTIPLSDLPLGA